MQRGLVAGGTSLPQKQKCGWPLGPMGVRVYVYIFSCTLLVLLSSCNHAAAGFRSTLALRSHVTALPCHCAPMSLQSHITALPRHYTSMSLHIHVTTHPCHYTPMSLHSHVTALPCHYAPMPLHSSITALPCHCTPMSLHVHVTTLPCHYTSTCAWFEWMGISP